MDQDRKNSIGIAFSGGGLQGIAHIGAIKALYELGIKPQYVSGTSSGSIMAAFVAMGLTPEKMQTTAEKHWKSLASIGNRVIFTSLAQLVLDKRITKDGLKSSEIISDIVKETMQENNITGFSDLPINLSVCTVDTLTMDECIFLTLEENLHNEHIHYITGAPLELAIRASMSFPAIYTSCSYDKYNFIDGGSKDNLPVKVLKDMGVGKVLAIGFDISNYTPSVGLDGLMKVIWRALDVYSIEGTRKSMEMADFTVQIKNENTAIFSIDNIEETIKEGYDAVMAKKEEILKIFA